MTMGDVLIVQQQRRRLERELAGLEVSIDRSQVRPRSCVGPGTLRLTIDRLRASVEQTALNRLQRLSRSDVPHAKLVRGQQAELQGQVADQRTRESRARRRLQELTAHTTELVDSRIFPEVLDAIVPGGAALGGGDPARTYRDGGAVARSGGKTDMAPSPLARGDGVSEGLVSSPRLHTRGGHRFPGAEDSVAASGA